MCEWHCPVAQESVPGCRNENAPTYVHGQLDKKRDCLLDDQSRKDRFEDISFRFRAKGVVCIGPGPMTNREAVQRSRHAII